MRVNGLHASRPNLFRTARRRRSPLKPAPAGPGRATLEGRASTASALGSRNPGEPRRVPGARDSAASLPQPCPLVTRARLSCHDACRSQLRDTLIINTRGKQCHAAIFMLALPPLVSWTFQVGRTKSYAISPYPHIRMTRFRTAPHHRNHRAPASHFRTGWRVALRPHTLPS